MKNSRKNRKANYIKAKNEMRQNTPEYQAKIASARAILASVLKVIKAMGRVRITKVFEFFVKRLPFDWAENLRNFSHRERVHMLADILFARVYMKGLYIKDDMTIAFGDNTIRITSPSYAHVCRW